MKAMVATWLFLRALRWLLWIAYFALSFYILKNSATVLTSFGQLPQKLEVLIFGLGCGAVMVGFLELMMRERTGLPRPPFGRMPRRV
jgi:hypothetical protein